jgi:hypothetical protein
MPRTSKVGSSASSIEVGEFDSTEDSSQEDSSFNEGRTNPEAAIATGPTAPTYTYAMPAPARIAVGSACAVSIISGIAMIIVGGIGLNQPDSSEHAMHKGVFGSGGALLCAGVMGLVPIFLKRQVPTTSASAA